MERSTAQEYNSCIERKCLTKVHPKPTIYNLFPEAREVVA